MFSLKPEADPAAYRFGKLAFYLLTRRWTSFENVSCEKMKWKLSSPEPQMLLYYFSKTIGLAPFTVIKNRFSPPTLSAKLYSVSIAAIYLLVAPMVINASLRNVSSHNYPMLVKTGSTIYVLIGFPAIFLTPIIFLITYKKFVCIMDDLRSISNELNTLGVEDDREKFFKNTFVLTVFSNIALIAAYVMLGFVELKWHIVHVIKYGFDNWYQFNTFLIYTGILTFIKGRFTLINRILYVIFGPGGQPRPRRIPGPSLVSVIDLREDDLPDVEDNGDLQLIQKIELLHLRLTDLVDRTTRAFELLIITKCLQSCVELMSYCFWVYSIIRHLDQLFNGFKIFTTIMDLSKCLLKMAILVFQQFYIVHAPVGTCREGNATRAVLSKVSHVPNPEEIEDEFSLFSLQLLHKRVIVSVFGIIELDYSILYKIFCAAMAYSLILVQSNDRTESR